MSAPFDCPPTPTTLLAEQAAAASDEASRHELRRRLVVLHLEAGDADAAARALDSMVWDGVLVWDLVDLFELVAARPGQSAVRERLVRHYECTGSLEDGARVRRTAVLVAGNPRERVRWVRELARHRLAHVGRETRPLTALLAEMASDLAGFDDALIAGYRTTLARVLPLWRAAPTDAAFEDAGEAAWQAIDGLVRLHLRRGNAERAARLLRRGARLRFEHSRRRRLLHRAAVLYADRVRDTATAMRLFKEIFDDGDDDEIARSSFDRFRALLASGGHDAKLAWLLERRGLRASRGGDAQGARAQLERAGLLWERASEPVRACEAYTAGAALGSERSLEALARIHTSRKNWEETAAALDQLAARSNEARRRFALRIAEVRLTLGHLELARRAVDVVLGAEPATEELTTARALLLRIHRQSGAFRSVAEMLEEDARQSGRGARAAVLLCEAGEIHRTKLRDAPSAIRVLELARSADPTNPAVHPALAEALAGLALWDRLIAVLAEHLSRHGRRRGAALLDVRLRLVDALLRVGRVTDALEQVQVAVKLDPSDATLLHTRARLERATGDLDAAERTLRAALVAGTSPREPRGARRRIDINIELSAIAVARGDRTRAAVLARFALELAIEQEEDPAAVEPLLRELGEHVPLARALEQRCRRASDVLERVAALGALVETWAGPLEREPELEGRLDGLFAAVRAAVDAVADDGPRHARATAALAKILEATGRPDGAVSLLEARWRVVPASDAEYLELAWALGRLLEQARRRTDARAVYEAIFDALAPRGPDGGALRALAIRLEALGSERLADCLEQITSLEPESVRTLGSRLLELRTVQGDDRGLVRALEKAVVATPKDRGLLWRLVDAHRRAGVDADSLGPLDAALRDFPDDMELRILRARVRERIDDVDGALDDLTAVLARDPAAAALAVPIVRRILHRAEGAPTQEHAIIAADILARLGLPDEAEDALEVVLRRNPENVAALQRLAASAVENEDWERAAELYGRLVNLVDLPPGDPASGGLAVAFADACLRAGRPGDARDALERALARRADPAVGCQLERTCDAMGAWQRLSELLVARAHAMADPAKKLRLLLRGAAVLVDEAAAHDDALLLLDRIAAEFPASVEASLAHARTLVALGRPTDGLHLLAPTLERAGAESAALRAEILLAMGKAHLALGDGDEAFAQLQAGFSLHTRNRELAMLLGVVAHDLGDDETAERALTIALDLAVRDDARADLAKVDARVAARILASIVHTHGAKSSRPPPRRLSGIQRRASAESSGSGEWTVPGEAATLRDGSVRRRR